MSNGYLQLQADMNGWKASKKQEVQSNEEKICFVKFLAESTLGADRVLEANLKALIDFEKILAILNEAPKEAGEAVGFLNSRKNSQLINQASELEGLQKKEKKEVSQFIRLFLTRKILHNNELFANYGFGLEKKEGTLSPNNQKEGVIQFIANYDDWKCIKKMKITEKSNPLTVLEFLGSYSVSLEKKLEEYLGEIINLESFNKFLKEAPVGKNASAVSKTIRFLQSTALENKISELTSDAQTSSFLKIYAVRKLLKASSQFAEFSTVDIPGLKRLLKKKAK
jgi:hypothetical protein